MKACRQCQFLFDQKDSQLFPEAEKDNRKFQLDRCPNCNSTDLSEDYSGMVLIFDPEKSEIAKRLNVTRKGQYALRVR